MKITRLNCEEEVLTSGGLIKFKRHGDMMVSEDIAPELAELMVTCGFSIMEDKKVKVPKE